MLPQFGPKMLDAPRCFRQARNHRRHDHSLTQILVVDGHQITPGVELPVAENVGDVVQRTGRCAGRITALE
jgi:hypothetical protein